MSKAAIMLISIHLVLHFWLLTTMKNLKTLVESPNYTQYKKCRLQTGIVKSGIFLGLPRANILSIPHCFSYDIMHLISLNISNFLISLWHSTIDCNKDNNCSMWDWAVLRGNTWTTHGKVVASITPYLPGSFNRLPRNPAEKINSGYKAWEYLMYIFGLGPGLFYHILPRQYWKNSANSCLECVLFINIKY